MFLHVLVLSAGTAALASARVTDYTCPATCAADTDCSLNGICNTSNGQCTCDPGWTGPCCGSLDLLPINFTAARGGYRHPTTSTWGGNILSLDGGKTFHMWIAEMAPNGTAGDPGAGSCGLTTWGSNSQITHVMSAGNYAGPYLRQEVAVGVWSHNPLVRAMPDGTLVMYHIGEGGGTVPGAGYCAVNATSPCGEQSFDQCAILTCNITAAPGYTCNPGFCSGDALQDGDCGADIGEPTLPCNGTWEDCIPAAAAACNATAGCVSFGLSSAWLGLNHVKLFSAGTGGLTPNSQWTVWVQNGHAASPSVPLEEQVQLDMYARAALLHGPVVKARGPDACTLPLHVSTNGTAGPWTFVNNATITPCGGNNPAPWVHPNGTVYLVLTDQNMGMWSAPTWQGPYTLVTTGACGGGEDPSLFLDKRGHWHCLFHRSPFSNPDIAIGHSYSVDGLTWTAAAAPAANSTIATVDYGTVVHGKRERPHLYFNAAGDPVAFVSGVCLTPQCDPFAGTFDPSADCTSGTQYHHCDANSPDGWYDRTYTLVQTIA